MHLFRSSIMWNITHSSKLILVFGLVCTIAATSAMPLYEPVVSNSNTATPLSINTTVSLSSYHLSRRFPEKNVKVTYQPGGTILAEAHRGPFSGYVRIQLDCATSDLGFSPRYEAPVGAPTFRNENGRMIVDYIMTVIAEGDLKGKEYFGRVERNGRGELYERVPSPGLTDRKKIWSSKETPEDTRPTRSHQNPN
ncbi:hypothetical protein F5878DRAFT_659734 [Lentinula raphanica]|uniref:Uncharacterized protein n=1 Tax=Lentinula raphanica TaxID=153919 RepID=A0AA38UFP4_9AGAR|nr:hypothetical protein F5878DRAFT_659734 [Lentinula raphanica]